MIWKTGPTMLLDMRIEKLIQDKFKGNLTEVQKKAIPLVYKGNNVLIMAPTGHGKTEAALLPVLSNMLSIDKKGIQLLYVTPLKALNRDMLTRVEWWCNKIGITYDVRHGDTPQYRRAKQSRKPPQVLITTPETLNAIIVNKYLGEALKNVRYLIIDEIHEIVDSKRGVQLSLLMERLDKRSIYKIQRIGLSATLGSPEKVARYLSPKDPVKIVKDKGEKGYDIKVVHPSPDKKRLALYAKMMEKLGLDPDSLARLDELKEIVKDKKTLIFVNTRATAEILASRLRMIGVSVGVHHGSLSREVRLKAENDFKKSKIKVLICTSSMELGIDIGDVDLVVQYVSPRQVKRLVQRVGRAGHHHEKISRGIIITIDVEDYLESLAITTLLNQKWIEPEHILTDSYDVIAQQVMGILLEAVNGFHDEKITLGYIHNILKNAYVYNLTIDDLSQIIHQLKDIRMIYVEEDDDIKKWTIIPRTVKVRMYYYNTLSTIPSTESFIVRDIVLNKRIGKLDEKFVMLLSPGDKFITKGVPWKVVDITTDEVLVEGIDEFSLSIPDWVGEELPVPYEVAQLSGRLREELGTRSFKRTFNALSDRLMKDLIPLPTDRRIVIESTPTLVVIHTCAGSRVNETIAKVIGHELAERYGPLRTSSDQYRVYIEPSVRIPSSDVKKILLKLKNKVNSLLDKIIPETNGFLYEVNHVAKLFGMLREGEKIGKRVVNYLKGTPIYSEALRSIKFKYYDVETTEHFLTELKHKKIECFDNVELSLWGKLGLTEYKFGDILGRIEPQKEVLEVFKRNILERRVKLKCTYCGHVWFTTLANLKDKIICEKCKSPMVGVAGVFREGNFYEKSEDEIKSSAPLVRGYGKRAVIALTIYGIGVKTASRILRMMRKNEDQFFLDLIEAQKAFIKNRRYWNI